MKKTVLLLLITYATQAFCGKIDAAYKALSIFDYFKAKELFYGSLHKKPAEASYGLAILFYRTDNPFSDIDSAAKYIAKSREAFKDTLTLSGFSVSAPAIHTLMYNISRKGFSVYSAKQSPARLNHFLEHFYFSSDTLLNQARLQRDQLCLGNYAASNSSDSMALFLVSYPESDLYKKAEKLFYDFQYLENTAQSTASQYKRFIQTYTSNPNIRQAEYRLFDLTRELHSPDSLYSFIKHYSKLTTNDAWKMLYSISVKNYSKQELNTFLDLYPDYPYRSEIEKEIVLSEKTLYPLKNNADKFGFIDNLGNWIIQPIYDDAGNFKEGFAGVCKNDSCFYITKDGLRTSVLYFEETEDYDDGLAIVKKQNAYYLINRSGQLITNGFEDINKASDNLFVCKKNNLYGAINAKGETVIPFSYNKLGNFKNGYAYYLSDKYGLVDIHNHPLKAQWDWISETDTNSLVIVKKALKFGLMTLNESLILNTEFDYISHCKNGIYLVIKSNLYGFYNATERCYMTAIAYDYDKSYPNEYYTNGKQFKLIEDEDVGLVDMNGRFSIGFGTYTNVFFARNDIIKIQKGKKFGYVDRKLKPLTAVEFDKASDFNNNTALVSKAGSMLLIDKNGKTLYTLKDGIIEETENGLFQTTLNGLSGLITNSGEVLLTAEFTSIHHVGGNIWRCTKNNELFIYRVIQKKLVKIID